MSALSKTYLSYGVPISFAKILEEKGISKTTFDITSKKTLIGVYHLEEELVDLVKHLIKRKPINEQIMQMLLENNNFCCCLCKTSKPFIIHHIIEHTLTQDNSYDNLAVLCLSHHDEAHKEGKTLTHKITSEQIKSAKANWEKEVKMHNQIVAQNSTIFNERSDSKFNYAKYSTSRRGAVNQKINVDISTNSSLILKVEQKSRKQEFVVYLSFKTDQGDQKWIGFATVSSINNRVYRDSEFVFRIGRSGKQSYKLVENVMEKIYESGLDFKGVPTLINTIRFRVIEDTSIDFYFEFREHI